MNTIKLFLLNHKSILTFFYALMYYSGFVYYQVCKLLNFPYLGGYLFSRQEFFRGRNIIIKRILKDFKIPQNGKMDILEIGVYAGGNTLLIAKTLKKLNIKFQITCVDPWKAYDEEKYNQSLKFFYKKFNDSLKNGKVFALYKHNIKSSGVEKHIRIIKKNSKSFFSKNSKKFDLIFIDGSHKFKDVFLDIKYSKKNLKESGLIIIDDYELKFSKTNLDKNFKNQCDFEGISSYSKNKQLFHPGVTKAVYKHFGNIEPVNGLMIVKKKKNIFKAVYSAYRG